MSETIDISVIVPVYNADKYLTRCLDSIISQTYQNIEIILVNDGSTDSSKKIIEEYEKKDKRVVALHTQNGGVSSARNKGINIAKGTYLCFVDADDYIHPDIYSSLISATINNNTDLAICDISRQTLIKTERLSFPGFSTTIFQDNDIVDHIICNITHNRLLRAPWNKLYKTSLINGHSIRFAEEVEYGEDFIFNIEYLTYVDRIFYLHEPLYYYDNTTEGASNTSRKNLLVSGKIMHDKLALCAERWGITSRKLKIESVGEYVFYARKQFRMNLNDSDRISYREQNQRLKDIIYDKDFKDSITKDRYVLFLVFLNKNFTCKLIILAAVLRFPGLLLPKIWHNYLTKNSFKGKHQDRQNQQA